MRRLLFALMLAAGLGLVAVPGASAAPQHPAAPVREASTTLAQAQAGEAAFASYEGSYGNLYHIDWYPNNAYTWQYASGSQEFYNGRPGSGAGGYRYWVNAGVSGGWFELVELVVDGSGLYWYNDGYCAGWNQDEFRVARQVCSGGAWQWWHASDPAHPGSPNHLWNYWYLTHYPNICTGSAIAVLTADQGPGAIYMGCPEGAGGHSYLSGQYWNINQ